ncbi:hypothetical protein L211DRAFT_782257 [Terfezia boudieri ATCC MYA-4762]|uniref:Uncharacterized protein n=1 Tax=Terfezia boudieri ATCC MYA-4762 TaxID=1051890 RepID=A0A3N4LSX3_9PEZI|nr:hypothetical protein L211DRAFT_782257 [Terfezia boudieri ATCC MYA-4762]
MATAYNRAIQRSDGNTRTRDRSSYTTSSPNSIPSLERSHDSTCSPTESEIFDYQKASVNTYCTTVDYEDEYAHYDYYDYEYKPPRNEAIPATPNEFAQLFPSSRKFQIKHDDASADGDMNIRIEKVVSPKRPALQRSVSRALQSFRAKSEQEKQMTLNRQDSGYGSSFDDEDEEGVFERPKSRYGSEEVKPSTAITMEFSNYAHVQVDRKGTKGSRKYDFEYWGKNYSWKRMIRKHPATGEDEISYSLLNNGTGNIVASIIPDPAHSIDEEGGEFVPACTFQFKESTQDLIQCSADAADVIMATGLMALVDDCIKRKYRTKKVVQLNIPLPMTSHLKMNMEYVGPKRLIDEVFNRRPTMLARSMSSPVTTPTSPGRRR